MTWFTANQVSVNNGSTIVTVTSGEDISNIRAGDALIVGSFAPVEINRAYVDGSNNKIIELKSAWSDSNQSNAAARVFPTAGDFKEAANALRDATQLTSDQFQTLTDWGTINGTVTFTDSSGQQYTARSLAKMDADVAAVQAQAESLVGSVVLPTKADFESRHEHKFAGSGFVEWGKHSSGAGEPNVNEGLWTVPTSTTYANGLLLGFDVNSSSSAGVSKTNHAIAYLAGSVININGTAGLYGYINGRSEIKFPPAPDGLDKADGTGRFASLAEAITAGGDSLSASVIHRQDLCILECWDEDISEKGNVLYPYGNVQYGGSWSGITLATSHVAQGYSAFFVGDTTTTGKGFILDLTNDNHVKFLQDKDNNCYTDNGKIIQRRYRIRTIAGLEGDWEYVGNISESSIRFSSTQYPTPQGQSTTPPSMSGSGHSNGIFVGRSSNWNSKETQIGVFAAERQYDNGTPVAYNGNCWAIPIALVQRRNKGVYHPAYNFAGTSSAKSMTTQDVHSITDKIKLGVFTTPEECFRGPYLYNDASLGIYADSGSVGYSGTYTGYAYSRPDEKYYDAIYASDVLDLRLSAHKVNAEVTANNDVRKAIEGTKRGWEAMPFTVTHRNYLNETIKVNGIGVYEGVVNGSIRIRFPLDTSLAPNTYSTSINPTKHNYRNKVFAVGDNGSVMDLFAINHLRSSDGNCYIWTGYGSNGGNRVAEFNTKFPVGTTITFVIENHVDYYQAEPTWTDIICRNIDDFVTAFPNGCAGQFNPLGLGLSGNQSAEYIELTKKAIATTSATMLHTDNQGGSWTIYTSTITSTLNQGTHQSTNTANIVALWNYKTKAKFTESSGRKEMLALPKVVFASNHGDTTHGCLLAQSIFGKIPTGAASWDRVNAALAIKDLKATIGTGQLTSAEPSIFHEPITIKNSNNSFAYKVTHHPVNVNGRLGVLWIGQEVKYDSAKDSNDVTVATEASQLYETGKLYRINVDGSGLDGLIVKRIASDVTTSVPWSSYSVTSDNQLLDSGNAISTSWVLWDGNGFGDNGTFTVGDNMAVITDDNENSIVRATHLQMTQYLYTEGM